MNYILINIIFISIGLCSQFDLGKFYVFKDPGERNLLRAQLSKKNSFLSAEVLYDGNDLVKNKREIIIFGFGDHPVHPDSGYFFGRDIDEFYDINEVHDGYLLNWSSHSDSIFYYFHFEDSDDASPNRDTGLQLRKSDRDPDQELAYKSFQIKRGNLLAQKKIKIKKIYDFFSIKDYHKESLNDKKDANFITYLDQNNKMHIFSDYSTASSSLFSPEDDSTIDNPESIRLSRRGADFDAVVTFNQSGKFEQDLCYFCDILHSGISSETKRLTIFPRTKDYQQKDGSYVPIRKQLEPIFSHDGRYLAFLNQDIILNRKMDLYVFDTNNFFHINPANERKDVKKRKGFCQTDDEVDDMLLDRSVIKIIDTNIVSFLDFEQNIETAKDYAWYPGHNVIFYIKEYLENEKVTFQLKTYDFENEEYDIVLESDSRMGYLSISDDGEYLMFSFIVLDKEFENYRGRVPDPYSRKIAVAELIKK